MSSFTVFDLEAAIEGFVLHSGGFDQPRAVVATSIVAGALRPLLAWVKETPDLKLISYSNGGYTCIGFEMSGVVVRGIPLYGDLLLNRSRYLIEILQAASDRKGKLTNLSFGRYS